MGRKRKRNSGEGANIDMTPMIDVVFQLIIFFVVTITVTDAKDESIRLELSPHGDEVDTTAEAPETMSTSKIVIDVNREGKISINAKERTLEELDATIKERVEKYGYEFEIWIRADALTSHVDVGRVMDVCTARGIGKISFLAVYEESTPEQQYFTGSLPKEDIAKYEDRLRAQRNKTNLFKRERSGRAQYRSAKSKVTREGKQ